MKKLVAMLLTLCIVAATIMGCSGENNNSGSNNNTPDNSANNSSNENQEDNQTPAEDEAPYEIVMEMLSPGMPQEDTAMIEEAINEITLPAINATVKFREISIADHATQVGLIGTDNDRLDIIFVGYTTNMANLKNQGILLGLGDLLEQYAPEMLEKAGILMQACYVDDDYYCVPGNYYPAEMMAVQADVQTWEEYGIELPEGAEYSYEYIDKLYDAIRATGYEGYLASAGDGIGIRLTGHYPEEFGSGSVGDGGLGILMDMDKDTQIINKYETDEFVQACLKQKELRDNGILVPDSLTNGLTVVDAMRSGQMPGNIGAVNATFIGNNEKITGRKMEGYYFGKATLKGSSIPEYGLGITVTSERPEKAMQLLNLIMTNAELANLMNYGIEGVHYEKVSEHIIRYPDGVDFSNIGYGMQICSYGDLADIYQREPFTEEFYETLDNFSADNAIVSNAFGYVFDTNPVKTQAAAVSAVIKEYLPTLSCGMVDDVEGRIEEFRAALKTAGVDEVIAENQRQFDEWRASK